MEALGVLVLHSWVLFYLIDNVVPLNNVIIIE